MGAKLQSSGTGVTHIGTSGSMGLCLPLRPPFQAIFPLQRPTISSPFSAQEKKNGQTNIFQEKTLKMGTFSC